MPNGATQNTQSTTTPAPRAAQTFYEIASSRLDDQTSVIDALDGKTATAFGFAGGLLPLFGAFFAKKHPPTGASICYAAALLAYLGLLTAAFLAYRVSDWSLRPDLSDLQRNSLAPGATDADLRQWAAEECVRSTLENEPHIHRKARLVGLAQALLAVVALLLSGASLFLLA